MFLVKGVNHIHKDFYTTLLSSVDMEEEKFLYLFSYGLTPSVLSTIDFLNFNTVNAIMGTSVELLTQKYNLINWFSSIKFSATLPAIVFSKFNKTDIANFLEEGTKLKFLKLNHRVGGLDVHVVDSVEEIKQFVNEERQKYQITHPYDESQKWILQDALEDVATYEGYKFHLRVLIAVVVRDKDVTVYISNYHAYEFSKELYDVKRLKERSIFNSHKHQNTKTAFFPMERPDHWTITDASKCMKKITKCFKTIFKHQHDFVSSYRYKLKNGFTLLGADVLFDSKQNPYILEINYQPSMHKSHDIFIPEYFHLAMGGAPLKLFSSLYGTSEGRTTPFTKPLQTFYETKYESYSDSKDAFKTVFLTDIDTSAVHSYLLYQNMNSKKIHRRTKRKSRLIL